MESESVSLGGFEINDEHVLWLIMVLDITDIFAQ